MPDFPVLDRRVVSGGDQVRTGDCLEQQQVQTPASGNQAVDAHRPIRPQDEIVQPSPACTRRWLVAADSRARIAVVPTATTTSSRVGSSTCDAAMSASTARRWTWP